MSFNLVEQYHDLINAHFSVSNEELIYFKMTPSFNKGPTLGKKILQGDKMLYYYKGATHLVNMEKKNDVHALAPLFCKEVLKGI